MKRVLLILAFSAWGTPPEPILIFYLASATSCLNRSSTLDANWRSRSTQSIKSMVRPGESKGMLEPTFRTFNAGLIHALHEKPGTYPGSDPTHDFWIPGTNPD